MIRFPKPDVEQFFRTYTISNFAVNREETHLVFSSNLNGKFNLWGMEMNHPYPYPLTYVDQNSSFIKWDPAGRYLLTGFDQDGDENYKIFALSPDGGVPQALLTGERSEKYFYGDLSEDGQRLYYMTSKENPTYLDIRVLDLESHKDRLLYRGEGGSTYFAAVSPDESKFVFTKHLANTYSPAYLVSGDSKVCLTPSEAEVHTVSQAEFVSDDELLFITNYGADFSYVASFQLESREMGELVKIPGEDVSFIRFHKESGQLYISTSQGVADRLYRFERASGTLVPLDVPVDVFQKVTVAKSGNLYLLGRSATVPFNIFVKMGDEDWQALTDNRVLGVQQDEMVEPDVITYKSFDGLEIEALLFKAKPETANGYTIFWPHGGPQAAERKFFRGLFQFLIGRGYHVFAPNFRGSSGYGAEFVKMVEGDWGEGPRLDCVAGIEWLFEQGIADRDKLFVVGGSYGGYMTLLLAGRHPEYFRAAVDIFGVSNLISFLQTVPDHWKPSMKRWLGDVEEDRERLIKDSPITYLDQMTKPLLIIQGANDPRVVKAESDQIYEALKSQGVEVEYLVLEDEGHGFSKKENEIKVNRLILEFLDRHQ